MQYLRIHIPLYGVEFEHISRVNKTIETTEIPLQLNRIYLIFASAKPYIDFISNSNTSTQNRCT